MKKKIIIIIFIIATIICILVKSYYDFFISMENLPEGEFLCSSESPDGTYEIKIYRCNGGATVDYSIRGELIEKDKFKSKNIYWSYRESDAKVEWVNDYTVIINGKMLNVQYDKYDFRREDDKEVISSSNLPNYP